MATFPTGTMPRIEPACFTAQAIRTKTSTVQSCTPSPLQGALFQLPH